jgi:CheY-like chemotaxis protein
MKPEHRTILFVEDEPLLGELMTEALTDRGFDIDLGDGMDGATLARLARQMRPKLPVVYASGRRSVAQLDTVPGSVFLPKPYSLNQVDATIAELVAEV